VTLELASVKAVPKPWGKADLRPWSRAGRSDAPIGELWFERADGGSPEPALLLKLLFTARPLSIQVHPDDSYARSIGQPHGKTEAWYVLEASRDAAIALGLERTIGAGELRAAVEDGSIADLVHWQHVVPGQAVLVSAGTIHAIGPGLVIAEIQQRSDATFRLFDYERHRALHLEDAIAVALAGPAAAQAAPSRLTAVRRLLAASPYFVLEHVALPPNSHWALKAAEETWALVLEGETTVGPLPLSQGQAIFIEQRSATAAVGHGGAQLLLAYSASAPSDAMLRRLDGETAGQEPMPEELHA
jgi:mannose-6-phosphate isomerase